MIRAGCADGIYAGYYVDMQTECSCTEAMGDWKDAASSYVGISTGKTIQERESACRRKITED